MFEIALVRLASILLVVSGVTENLKTGSVDAIKANPLRLELRLSCPKKELLKGRPFYCDTYLVLDPSGGAAYGPSGLLPFDLDFRPRTKVSFNASSGSTKIELPVSKPAVRGLYDMGRMTQDELILITPGAVRGRRYDLNGRDWLFPSSPGTYELRARVEIRLLKRDEKGKLEPAVRAVLGRREALAEQLVLDGEWDSNPQTVTVVP